MLDSGPQAASVGELLLNDPAVRPGAGFGNFQQVYLVEGCRSSPMTCPYNGSLRLAARPYLLYRADRAGGGITAPTPFLERSAPGGSGFGGAVKWWCLNVRRSMPLSGDPPACALVERAYVAGDFARALGRRSFRACA